MSNMSGNMSKVAVKMKCPLLCGLIADEHITFSVNYLLTCRHSAEKDTEKVEGLDYLYSVFDR